MAQYAKIDENNIVVYVMEVLDEKIINPETGQVDYEYGELICNQTYEGRWAHTYAILPFEEESIEKHRKCANIGDTYHEDTGIFISPQPYPSWSLNEKTQWVPPIEEPKPERSEIPDKSHYVWDEDLYQSDNSQGWVLKTESQRKLDELGLTVEDLKEILGL